MKNAILNMLRNPVDKGGRREIMKKSIITLSREFGSRGRYIGELLADKIGYKIYDREISLRVAEISSLDPEFIEMQGERAASKSVFSFAFAGRTMDGQSVDDVVFNAQQKVIREIAEEGNCIIIGRNSDYILRDRDDVMHVFIYGNDPEKIQYCKDFCDARSDREAMAMIKEMDKKRALNYQYYTDQKWGAKENYDILLNSSTYGYEGCADILAKLLSIKRK